MRAKTRRSFKGEGSTTGKNQPNYMPLNRAIDRVIREREASGDLYPRKGSFEDQQRYRLDSQDIAREKGYFVPFMPKREVTSIEYAHGGSMDMPLPESIRGDRRFQSMYPKYIGKLGDKFDGDADNGYVAGDLRFYSMYDDGFYIVDKDDNVWSTEKWYQKGLNRDREYSMDDYVKEKMGAERFMLEGEDFSGREEEEMAREATGGMGASATEDLLERLGQYKRNAYGNKYEQGGEVKGNGPSIKIPGQYAYEPIATTESGEQYVTMELPDGTMATVFGDWETYGNPSQEGYIEDIDYRIIPRGDGSYELDAGEMESEMLRDESREFSRDIQGGPGASPIQDLLEKLSDRPGMGMTPGGRMRPIKRR
jgi:hypothetical protein